MKKAIIAGVLGLTALSAQAEPDYQKVVEINKSATEIIKAVQVNLGTDVKQVEVVGNSIKFKARSYCGEPGGFFDTAIPYNSDMVVEAKDGRYRVTIMDGKLADSPFTIHDHKKGAVNFGMTLSENTDTYNDCIAGFDRFIDGMNKSILSYSDF